MKRGVLTRISTVERCGMPPRAVWYAVIKVFGEKGKENGNEVQSLVKVKCTLIQALRLCTGRTAHRGSIGIALLFQNQRH